MRIVYYTTPSGENPVKEFINSLEKKDKAKIFRIFQNIQNYGLISIMPHVKKLTGTQFWEMRILGQNNIRIIYILLTRESVLVLHGFLKKTQKTPHRELEKALARINDYKKRA